MKYFRRDLVSFPPTTNDFVYVKQREADIVQVNMSLLRDKFSIPVGKSGLTLVPADCMVDGYWCLHDFDAPSATFQAATSEEWADWVAFSRAVIAEEDRRHADLVAKQAAEIALLTWDWHKALEERDEARAEVDALRQRVARQS